ncbi:uncharacterized protein [Elaeis guineensis]|uniref:uncharacterized protein n=1 Tax=Elaeis guineensis var. tenera TaxID=51953 RepID=UPI003C6D4D1E
MLIIGKSSIQRTHYVVLSVREDASYDEIRAGNKAAILNSNPAHLHGKIDKSGLRHKSSGMLRTMKPNRDMAMETLGDVQEFFYQCRHGDYFSITLLELGEMGISSHENVVDFFFFLFSCTALNCLRCY